MDLQEYRNKIYNNSSNSLMTPPPMNSRYTFGTAVFSDYLSGLDYAWDNYSSFFSIYRLYRNIKNYENIYRKTSSVLLNEWKNGSLQNRDSQINDWLTTYLQIKDFIR